MLASYGDIYSLTSPINLNKTKQSSFAVSKNEQILNVSTFLTTKSFEVLLKDIDTFIFDADGVLMLGNKAIPGSPEFIDYLISKKKQIIILTNNATESRAEYEKKLKNLGFNDSINKQNIVNPAAIVADTLYRAGLSKNNKKVYLIGCQGIKDELDDLNIHYFGDGRDPIDNQPASKNAVFLYDINFEIEKKNVGAVVVGYEKYFNYCKLMKAANYLQSKNCLFIATNEDETLPSPNPGTIIPDAGPIVAAVKIASGREPLVVGKPNTPAFEYICRRWKIDPKKTIMFGDRTNTDVKFGKKHNLITILVLSGCHKVDDIIENNLNECKDMVPDYYTECLGKLIPDNYLFNKS